MAKHWKKGPGKLGFLQPLLGRWQAEAETPMGSMHCTRTFEEVLGGAFVRLTASWRCLTPPKMPPTSKYGRGPYEELALIGVGTDAKVCFWSFTSDGKQSHGNVADVSDLHHEAIGFEAQMPAGLARMAYWPDDEGGFFWVVESKSKKGWKRFVTHRYREIEA